MYKNLLTILYNQVKNEMNEINFNECKICNISQTIYKSANQTRAHAVKMILMWIHNFKISMMRNTLKNIPCKQKQRVSVCTCYGGDRVLEEFNVG